MIRVGNRHPFAAAADFALEWILALVDRDLQRIQEMVDLNASDPDLALCLSEQNAAAICDPREIEDWTFHILSADISGFSCDFEVPFANPEYRPMMARFHMRKSGQNIEIEFLGIAPS